MPPRRRSRRSDADSPDDVRRKITEKKDEIIGVFGSVEICKNLHGDYRKGNRDERTTRGHKLYKSLKDLRTKLNRLIATNVQQPPPLENFQSAGNNRLGGDSEVTSLRREDRNDDTVNNDLTPTFNLLNFNSNNDDENEGGGIELNSSRVENAPLRREDRIDDTVNNDLTPTFNLLNFNSNNDDENEGGGIELNRMEDSTNTDTMALDNSVDLNAIGTQCDNCRRKQFTNDGVFAITFVSVSSLHINPRARYKNVKASNRESTAIQLTLCNECWCHLRKVDFDPEEDSLDKDNEDEDDNNGEDGDVEEDVLEEDDEDDRQGKKKIRHNNDFKYVAFAFLWDVLNGGYKNYYDAYKFHEVYGDQLWQVIPQSMRRWWIDEIKTIQSATGDYPFQSCDLNTPPSVFVDKTEAAIDFEDEIKKSLPRMGKALDRDDIMDQNVLCPCGCRDSYGNCTNVEWSLLIQFMLKKIVLKLPVGLNEKYRYYMHTNPNYYRRDDSYPCLYENDKWKVKPTVVLTKGGVWKALACAHHGKPIDKYRLYLPSNPYGFSINSRYPDNISPVRINPRVVNCAKASSYAVTSRMVQQHIDYKGADSFYLSPGSNQYGQNSHLQSYHNASVFIGRSDIRAYMEALIKDSKMSREYYTQIESLANSTFPNGVASLNVNGSTYIPFNITMRKWLSMQKPDVVEFQTLVDGVVSRNTIKRSWLQYINVIQMEDEDGYGCQFRAIPKFRMNGGANSLVAWMLYALLSSSSELWDLIDKKTTFEEHKWQGLILTNIGYHCYQQETVTVPKNHPFKKLNYTNTVKTLNEYCGVESDCQHLSVLTEQNLLPDLFSSYGDSMKIFHDSPENEPILNGGGEEGCLDGIQFLLFIGQEQIIQDTITADGNVYEHRVLLCIDDDQNRSDGRGFNGFRVMRYGGKFKSYWIQHRGDSITAQFRFGSDLRYLPYDQSHYVSLYVRDNIIDNDMTQYRDELLKSVGGQVNVRCGDCNAPLIPTGCPKDKKKKCNAWTGEGVHQPCKRVESYVCCNPSCKIRCCRKCLKSAPKGVITKLVPYHGDDEDTLMRLGESSDDDEEEEDDEDDDDIEDYTREENQNENQDINPNESDINDSLVRGISGTDEHMNVIFNEDIRHHTCPHDLIRSTPDDNFVSNDVINGESIPSTNAGHYPTHIDQSTNSNSGRVGGKVIFNQVGSLLKRRNKTFTGTQQEENFVQQLCSAQGGHCNSVLYPESSIFSRHLYCNATSDGITPLGALPVFCFRGGSNFGLAPICDQLRSRSMSPDTAASTDPDYTSFVFDVFTNTAANHADSRVMAVRGLQVNGKKLTPREEDSNSDIFGSDLNGDQDSHKMVRQLCASMAYMKFSHFYTFTCNHRNHPGIRGKHEWREGQEWLKKHPHFPTTSCYDEQEFIDGFNDAYSHLITPKWLDVANVLLKAIVSQLTHIGAVLSIFARHEYQDCAGNVSHIHLILAVDFASMNKEEVEEYISELIAAQVLDVIPPEKLHELINEGFLDDEQDASVVEDLARLILRHDCTPRCQRTINAEGDTKCRKLHSVKDSPDPTKDSIIKMPHKWATTTLDLLESIGIYNGETGTFTSPYFEPSRHISACQPNALCNMSPCDGKLFCILRSMQNLQIIHLTNCLCRYILKYIVKIDEGNMVTLSVDHQTGNIKATKHFLHNTKITSSKMNEEKFHSKQRHRKHPKGREISLAEQIHKISLQPEVFTNMSFIDICTLPFEHRPQTKFEVQNRTKRTESSNDDNSDEFSGIDETPNHQDSLVPTEALREAQIHSEFHLTKSQKLTYNERKSKSFDKVSEYGMREPRLLIIVSSIRIYFRCVHVDKKITKESDIAKAWEEEEKKWFDLLRRWTRLRMSALDELKIHIETNKQSNEDDPFSALPFDEILEYIRLAQASDESLSREELRRKKIVMDVYILDDSSKLPPIPVFSTVTPMNPHFFITHIILTLGTFETEKDIFLSQSMRDCFRKAKLIGNDDSEDALEQDVGKILHRYIMEQLIYSPFAISKAEYYILMANQVLRDAIISNGISIFDMSPVTMVSLCEQAGGEKSSMWSKAKEFQIDAISHQTCTDQAPSKEDLMNCSRYLPVAWDPNASFTRSPQQSDESYDEQIIAIGHVVKEIRTYINEEALIRSINPIIHGCPGSGKSFVSLYCMMYAISQGLNVCPTSLTGINAARIGGLHWHPLFKVDPNHASAPPSRQAELAIMKIERDEMLLYKIQTMDVLFIDEFFQFSSEQLAVTEIILRKVRHSTSPFGGVLLISNMDHTQGGAINGTPLLVSSLMFTCFKMIELRESVRAHGNRDFIRLQQITRMSPFTLQAQPSLVEEFKDLASNILTYVHNWDEVPPSVLRCFSRRNSTYKALELATQQREAFLHRNPEVNHIIIRSDDTQRRPGSHEWSAANRTTIDNLNVKCREVECLILCRGDKVEITINDTTSNGDHPKYFQSQTAVIYNVPDQESIDQKKPISVLIPPPGLANEIDLNESDITESQLIEQGWKKVKIPMANQDKIVFVNGGLEARRGQYALRPMGQTTISKAQGMTLPAGIAIEYSRQFYPFNRDLIVVALSRSEKPKKTILVGDKSFIVDHMAKLIQKPSQYTRLIEETVKMMTVNQTNNSSHGIDLNTSFPFRKRHYQLPIDNSGFVYILYSTRDKRVTYTGETENINTRLIQHNNGIGGNDSAPAHLRPWALGAFIASPLFCDKQHRVHVENLWRQKIRYNGSTHVPTLKRIHFAEDIVSELNTQHLDDQFRFCITVDKGSESEVCIASSHYHMEEEEPYQSF